MDAKAIHNESRAMNLPGHILGILDVSRTLKWARGLVEIEPSPETECNPWVRTWLFPVVPGVEEPLWLKLRRAGIHLFVMKDCPEHQSSHFSLQ